MFGLGLGRMGLVGDLGFAIRRSLFGRGEQGLWYDLNDDNTIFQDSAGTTLASWGDPVGRVNDKSGRGNNAVQSTSGSRPIRGRMPKRGRVNLLVSTGNFANAAWTKADSSVGAVDSDGYTPFIPSTANTFHSLRSTITGALATTTYTQQVELKYNSIQYADVVFGFSTLNLAGYANRRAVFDLINGTLIAAPTGGSATIAPNSTGGYLVTVTITTGAGSGSAFTDNRFDINSRTSISDLTTSQVYVGDGTSYILVKNPQRELGSTATAYQHVIDSLGFNVTETGQPSCGYLSYNGSNQWMQTAASVNFSATDEMSVFAGVRKVSDAARGQLIEHSVNWTANVGSFSLRAPEDASNRFSYISAGNNLSGAIATTSSATYNAPINVVETGISDISADSCLLRLNGVQVSSSASDQGTGNYGNYVTYFGARAGTSLYFNGLMFSTIIRGALTSGTLLTRTEQYVARQTPTVNL